MLNLVKLYLFKVYKYQRGKVGHITKTSPHKHDNLIPDYSIRQENVNTFSVTLVIITINVSDIEQL